MNTKPARLYRHSLLAMALGLISGILTTTGTGEENPAPIRPNILVILVDDLGYGDLSCYGAKDLQTPNIDKLTSEGLRFTEFYANCCVCSPTRASLMTGRYPEFVGIPGVVRTEAKSNWGHLTPDSIFLPDLFRKAGYHTAITGKWHLGLDKPNCPNSRGFDEFRGFLGDMMDDYWTHRRHGINYMRINEEETDPKGHATDIFTQWCCESIRKQTAAGKPFFHYLAYNAPHSPIQPPPEWLEKVKQRNTPGITEKRAKIAALIEHLDDNIGKVLKTLDECGATDRTIVVFSSDNGGSLDCGSSNGTLRSGKGHIYEGGIKVTTSLKWPGHIKPGRQSDFRALTMDILPTLADICGINISHPIEGRSFKKLLIEGNQDPFNRAVFHMWRERTTKETMRQGDWKIIRDRAGTPFELYNITVDPSEKTNLADQQPEKLREMAQALEAHMKAAHSVPWTRP